MKKIKAVFAKTPRFMKIGLLIFIFSIVTFILIIRFSTQSSVSNELSDRSKEYLRGEKNRNESVFNNFDVENNYTPKSELGESKVGNCFSIAVPFVVHEKRSRDTCFVQFLLDTPKGIVAAYEKNTTSQDIEELSDIQFRRQSPKDYQEEIKQENGLTFYIYKKNDPYVYEKMALVQNKPGKILVVSLTANTNENLDSKFDTILESIKVSR